MTDAGPTALTRIAVVDDHPVFREGTAALLAREPDFDVVALGASPEDALAIASAALLTASATLRAAAPTFSVDITIMSELMPT